MDQACQEALKTIIKRRRDVRAEFTGDPLGEDELADLLNAAHAAPSVGNSQPWDFIVVRDPATLDAFAEHVAQCRQDYADSLDGEQREKFNPSRSRASANPGWGSSTPTIRHASGPTFWAATPSATPGCSPWCVPCRTCG